MLNQAMQVPHWLSMSAVYQINPRTFSKEGTIAAVTQQLPRLKELGFGVVYLCPIFEEDEAMDHWSKRQIASETQNPKNPYRMLDYFTIDSEYGTMDDLRAFVEESHRLGMKVLLDLVYLHAGPNARILQRHPEFAQQNPDGSWILNYWNFATFDYTCAGTREYLWSNMVYYIGALDVDGFRCDVGDQVPEDFWVEGRRRIQTIKPDAVLINEGRKFEWMKNAFDGTYAFAWHERLYGIFANGESAALLRQQWEEDHERMPAGGLLMRDIDNHDTATDWPVRTEIAAGHDGMEQIEVINYLMDGFPMVYCGNEIGDMAHLSMFANRFHPGKFEVTDWNTAAEPYAQRRQQVIRQLNALKAESEALLKGTTRWLEHDQPEKVIAFQRVFGDEVWTFVGNAAAENCTVKLDAELAGEVVFGSETAEADSVLQLGARQYLVLHKA